MGDGEEPLSPLLKPLTIDSSPYAPSANSAPTIRSLKPRKVEALASAIISRVPCAAVALSAVAIACLVRFRRRRRRNKDSKAASQTSQMRELPVRSSISATHDTTFTGAGAFSDTGWPWLATKDSTLAGPRAPRRSLSIRLRKPLEHDVLTLQMECTPEVLLRFLFHPSSAFEGDFFRECGRTLVRKSPWVHGVPGVVGERPWVRTVAYDLPVRNPFGTPIAHTMETQSLSTRSPDAWCVDIIAKTENMPMGRRFRCHVRIVGQRTPSAGPPRTVLSVSCAVEFVQGVGVFKGIIRKRAVLGMSDAYGHMRSLVETTFSPRPSAAFTTSSITPVQLASSAGGRRRGSKLAELPAGSKKVAQSPRTPPPSRRPKSCSCYLLSLC